MGSESNNSEESFDEAFEFEAPSVSLTKVEAFIVRAVVENRMIAPEQLQECLNERNNLQSPAPLAAYLLKKGFISDDNLQQLLQLFTSAHESEGTDTGMSLGQSAMEKGLASSGDILSALELQEKEKQKGGHSRLGEVLVKRGTLTLDQVKNLLEAQGKRILRCASCRKQYNVESYSEDKEYTCLACGAPLHDTKSIKGISVEGTAWGRESSDASIADLPEGTHVGPCRIEKKIGQGGMGAVYKARHVALNKTVALKIMSSAMTGDEHKQRFLREARTAASIEHPNVVVVHDTGYEFGHPFIVMQYIEGRSIADIINKKGIFPPKQMLRIGIAAAAALAAAHEKHLIHRDIKPENIMVTMKGEVKVTDFGLAKSTEHRDMTITSPGTVMGTPTYMAPEQFEGKDVDERADIYSLGITFYTMLAGFPPFEGDNPFDLWEAHKTKLPPPLENKIPESLREIIYQMLEKNPRDRYRNASDLADDLKKTYQEMGGSYDSSDYMPLFDNTLAQKRLLSKSRIGAAALLLTLIIVLAVILTIALVPGPEPTEHPTPQEMENLNAARSRSDRLALDHKYNAALAVWEDFKETNPDDFWKSFVENERSHVLEIAGSTLGAMMDELGTHIASGNMQTARKKCMEILAVLQDVDDRYRTPAISEVQQLTNERLLAIDKAIEERTTSTAIAPELLAKWKNAKELAGKQLERRQFALARFTCIPFTSSDYPVEIRTEAERKIAEAGAREQEHQAMLIAREKALFEQEMLEARKLIQQRSFEKAGEILDRYIDHDDGGLKREANLVLAELRSAEAFSDAMNKADSLAKSKQFKEALDECGRYLSSRNPEWDKEAREKVAGIKKVRFLEKRLVYVEGGSFTLEIEIEQRKPLRRKVTLKPFYLGKFEVSNGEYLKFIKDTGHAAPANWPNSQPQEGRLSHPVVLVTPADAQAYCAWLTRKEGVKYRLPTEAEWEIAASWNGKQKLRYPWGDTFRKNICNLEGELLPVGTCKGDLSHSGAYDMAGNACEITVELDGKGHVIRGGCCEDFGSEKAARVSCRQKLEENSSAPCLGFRVVREDK